MGSSLKVGVIGIGHMGAGIAKNLVDAGYPVIVNDIDASNVARLVEYGATSRKNAAHVAEDADVVLSSLPAAAHVRAVALGEGGLIEAEEADFVYIDMSTVGARVIREVADSLERPGVQVMDAPVTGGQDGAEAGTLRFMVGFDKGIPDSISEIFDVLGVQVVHVGGLGAGQVAKVCNNMMSAASLISLSEAFVYAQKAGISQHKLLDAIEGGTGETWVSKNRASEIIDHNFEPGFRASYLYKDLRIAVDDAQEYGVPLPIGSTSHELFKSLEQQGKGDRSVTAMIGLIEELAGMNHTRDK